MCFEARASVLASHLKKVWRVDFLRVAFNLEMQSVIFILVAAKECWFLWAATQMPTGLMWPSVRR